MEQNTSTDTNIERSYIAFISYRHTKLDREAAERVQKKIENYIVPKEFREKAGGKKLGMCFRDEDELPASSSLSDSIYYALDHTKFLIVICTPNLPLSKWCEAEIRYFLETHDRDHLLAVLADGTPAESFSPYMLHDYDENGEIVKDWEPLAANIAGENHTIDRKAFKKESVRIFAALIGCPFDTLWQRERRARTYRLVTAGAAAFAVMAVFLGVVLNRNARIEEQNIEIASQNEEIEKQNEELSEKNSELEQRMSSLLVDSGKDKLRAHNVTGAMEDGINALAGNDPEIYDHRAGELLGDALCVYNEKEIQSRIIYEQTMDIMEQSLADDRTHVVFSDKNGTVRCLDLNTNEVQWELQSGDKNTRVYTENLGKKVLYMSEYGLYCVSLTDGSSLWSFEHPENGENYFQAISGSGQIFAVAEKTGDSRSGDTEEQIELVFLSTEDGRELGRTDMMMKEYVYHFSDHRLAGDFAENGSFAASFSEDETIFSCILPVNNKEEDPDILFSNQLAAVFTIDMETFTRKDIQILDRAIDHFYGIDTDSEDGSVFWAGYSAKAGGIYTAFLTENEKKEKVADFAFRKVPLITSSNALFSENKCHMLAASSDMVVFSDNSMFVYDRNSNVLRRNYTLTDTITNAYWIDRESDCYEIALKDGTFIQYTLGSEDMVMAYVRVIGNDLESSRHPILLENSIFEENGSTLSIGGDNNNCLLRTNYVSDPGWRSISFDNGSGTDIDSFDFIPGSDRFFVFQDGNVTAADKNTGEVLEQAYFEEGFYLYNGLVVLDDDHFLIGNTSYCMDGTTASYASPVELSETLSLEPVSHIRLEDGSVLSRGEFDLVFSDELNAEENALLYSQYSDYFEADLQCFWKDGEPLSEINEKKNALIMFTDDEDFIPQVVMGSSGLVTGFGSVLKYTDGGYEVEEQKKYHFIDTSNGKKMMMENPFPDSGDVMIAAGTREKVAAAVYEDGHVCVLRPEENKAETLDRIYSPGEVEAVCFSKGDEYLLLLNSIGRIDIYETGTGTLMFSEIISEINEAISTYDPYDLSFDTLSAEIDAAGDQLLVYTDGPESYAVIIDRKGWNKIAAIARASAYDGMYNKIYGGSGSKIYTGQLYSIEDLKEMAEKSLG